MPLSLLNHSALALFAQRTRIPTSARSIGFCAIWVCISSSLSSKKLINEKEIARKIDPLQRNLPTQAKPPAPLRTFFCLTSRAISPFAAEPLEGYYSAVHAEGGAGQWLYRCSPQARSLGRSRLETGQLRILEALGNRPRLLGHKKWAQEH